MAAPASVGLVTGRKVAMNLTTVGWPYLDQRKPIKKLVTLHPIGRPVRATITLYPIGRPVRATITLYPIGDLLELLLHCIL